MKRYKLTKLGEVITFILFTIAIVFGVADSNNMTIFIITKIISLFAYIPLFIIYHQLDKLND